MLPVFNYYRQRWQAPDVPAEKESSVRIYARYVSSEMKRQKFSWSLLTLHLYTKQLACELQTGSLAHCSVPVRNGTKRNDQFHNAKNSW